MAEFKELLGKYIEADKLDGVVEELNRELPKNFIPKGRFNEVNEELKVLKGQLEESKKAMESLSQKAGSVEEYEKKLADLQKQNSEIEANSQKQIASITKRTQLKELLMVNNAHKDALDLLVEKYSEIAETDGDKLKDPDKLLEMIKKDRPGMFITVSSESENKGSHKENPTQLDSTIQAYRKAAGLK